MNTSFFPSVFYVGQTNQYVVAQADFPGGGILPNSEVPFWGAQLTLKGGQNVVAAELK